MTPEMEAFVAGQKNFSKTMYLLIQKAIAENGGIPDVSGDYDNYVMNFWFKNQKEKRQRANSPPPKHDPSKPNPIAS